MIKKWTTKKTIESFARRFKRIENQALIGALTAGQAKTEWAKCILECNRYLYEVPEEYLPEYLHGRDMLDDKDMIRRVMSGSK